MRELISFNAAISKEFLFDLQKTPKMSEKFFLVHHYNWNNIKLGCVIEKDLGVQEVMYVRADCLLAF